MADGGGPEKGERAPAPVRAALWALCATGLVYVVAIVGFLAMVWTLFQLLMWVFTG